MLDKNVSIESGTAFLAQGMELEAGGESLQDDQLFGASVVFKNRLQLMAPDGIVPRECLPALKTAEQILKAAHANAQALSLQAHADAVAVRAQAEVEGQQWLEAKQRDLHAEMAFQQTEWLAQLQPVWMQALERTLRSLCSGSLRPEVLAGALEVAVREFRDLSELHIQIHPDDLDSARAALTQLVGSAGLVRFHADCTMESGSCRLRNSNCEVTMHLDRAIALALGELCPTS